MGTYKKNEIEKRINKIATILKSLLSETVHNLSNEMTSTSYRGNNLRIIFDAKNLETSINQIFKVRLQGYTHLKSISIFIYLLSKKELKTRIIRSQECLILKKIRSISEALTFCDTLNNISNRLGSFDDFDKTFLIIGTSFAGKSTLFSQISNNHQKPTTGSSETNFPNFSTIFLKGKKLQIVDTPPITALDTSKKKTADLLSLALRTCPAFNLICVFDISETSFLNISEQISIVNKIKFHKSYVTRIIVINTKGKSYNETLNSNVIDSIKKELAFA